VVPGIAPQAAATIAAKDMESAMTKLQFNAFESPMGGEVVDFDAKAAFDDDTYGEFKRLLRERIVVVVRDQHDMTPDQLEVFTRRFGGIKRMHLAQYQLDGHPEIWVISNIVENGKPLGLKLAGTMWHTDEMYLENPVSYTFLLGKEVPPAGGDTLFANMYAAYDALPESTKAEIDDLRVVVSRVHAYQAYYPDREPLTADEKAALPEVTQPLVRVHPETGRKALYCGGGEVAWNIVGAELLKGQSLLRELRHFATMPRFVYTHEWRTGDLVFWDNRCSLHSATLFDTEKYRRLAWRTTVLGEAAIPVTREAAE
jgi:taurine dioxygenase/putative 2-oxoglutarate oxygenase